MKHFLLFLFAVSFSLNAQVTCLRVEPLPEQKNPNAIRVTAYGLLPEGEPKVFTFVGASFLKKFTDIEGSASFGLNRKSVRCWIYFHQSDVIDAKTGDVIHPAGSLDRIDFQTEPPFASLVWRNTQAGSGAKTKIADLKAWLESQP